MCRYRLRLCCFLALALLLSSACSIKKRAINTLASVLGDAEQVYLSDEDPELVGEAFPFNLKTIEVLLESNPRHRGLLLTATRAFLFYSYGFVEPEADRIESEDLFQARQVRRRAAQLYLRAYRYGLRGLEVKHPGISELLPREPEQAAARLKLADVPLAVWTAAALGAAVGAATDDMQLTADIAVVGALLERALQLDRDYQEGTVHEFLISYESQRVGGSVEKARRHYEQALQLSGGKRCGIWLAWVENFSIPEQDRQEFELLLDRVLAFDVNAYPENRLLSILAQRRARRLQQRADDLFLPQGGSQ